MKTQAKKLLSRWPFLKASAYIADDLMRGIRLANGQLATNLGATHSQLLLEESVDYINGVFSDYKRYGSIDKFYGVAAELGPGDNAGVALLMRQDGCEQVDLVDRFVSHCNADQQNKIYKELAQRHALDEFIINDLGTEHRLVGINWRIGDAAEVYFQQCAQKGQIYDFIVSRAVLEHLYNPLNALRDMVACLKTGGKMLHKIDFRDHGMFKPIQPELTFLQFPSSIYPLMVRNSGRPNRILLHRYREVLEEMKNNELIDYSLLVTSLVNVGQLASYKPFDHIDFSFKQQAIAFVEKHREKFASEFHHADSQDLAVSGTFLIVTKK